MNIGVIRYFEEVARAGILLQRRKRLAVSQQRLNKAITSLERDYRQSCSNEAAKASR